MRVTSLFLADHAQAVNGKLYVTGGAWDTINARKFPVTHPHLSVCLALEVGWEDHGREVRVEVKLLDADGRPLLPGAVGGLTRARRSPDAEPGDTTPLLLVFNLLGLRFDGPGDNTVSVEIDGVPSASVRLKVRERKTPGPPHLPPTPPEQSPS